MSAGERPADEMLAELAGLGSATVYEAGGRRGFVDLDLHRIVPGSRIAGPARTVRCGQDDNLMVHAAIERIRPGEVLVLAMPEPAPVALVGDLLATQARVAGAAGIVIDGAARDIEELVRIGLPIWARWIRVRGATKERPGAFDVPLVLGGATIRPGDVLVADGDGVAVVELERLAEVRAAAAAREDAERARRELLAAGERSFELDGLRAAFEGG